MFLAYHELGSVVNMMQQLALSTIRMLRFRDEFVICLVFAIQQLTTFSVV